MKIGPISNTTPFIGEKNSAAQKTDQGLEKQGIAREDQLNISEQARELQTKIATKSHLSGELENKSEKKLDLIRLKISMGHYDKPQTIMKISEKLSDDKEILREYYRSIF